MRIAAYQVRFYSNKVEGFTTSRSLRVFFNYPPPLHTHALKHMNKLEDLRSCSAYLIKIGQGQLRLIVETYFGTPYMGVFGFFFIWNYHVCIVARSGSIGAIKLKKTSKVSDNQPISGLPLGRECMCPK